MRQMPSTTGVMFFTDQMPGAALVDFARRVETLAYDTLWLPELFGREVFSSAGYLLAATERLRIASGIANVYARDALAFRQAANGLAELSNGRFCLGLGVSNTGIVAARGQQWLPPVAKMTAFFDAFDAAIVHAPQASRPAPVYLAAHGPHLLRLAAQRTDGANTYLMTPEHTCRARGLLGAEQQLNVVQHCMLWPQGSVTEARSLARRAVGRYVELDYYRRQWSQLGFADADFAERGSDSLIDALVAWGDVDSIAARLQRQRDAGADQVIVVPLNALGGSEPDWALLEALAPAA
jgi:probable F420-dependent oxidoreductase